MQNPDKGQKPGGEIEVSQLRRGAGILCHPTSFPGDYGIGDLGEEAYKFIQFLADGGATYWQVLPLNPTGYGDSPYQSFSAFAGNTLLLSPDEMVRQGYLSREEITPPEGFSSERVEFGRVIPWKANLLSAAFERFREYGTETDDFEEFCRRHKVWLDDFALFMALKDVHLGKPWVEWVPEYRDRDSSALEEFRAVHRGGILRHKFGQFLFYRQWHALKAFAHDRGIQIIGDVPIYVSHDSADVWSNRGLFRLDEMGNPTVMAGVPPDYFSKSGQLWGNPIYRWDVEAKTGFSWWCDRMKSVLELTDVVRLDHFRGFAGYWEVPAGESTAVNGRWVKGPGEALFNALEERLGGLPVIAEDLGEITPDVIALRDQFGFPGMKIMQFGFSGDPDHEFLPHTYPLNCVAYTGSHDNETLPGWYKNAQEDERAMARRYLDSSDDEFHWKFIERLWESRAVVVVAQMQDLLGIGDEGRMNFPSVPAGNWQWRFARDEMPPMGLERLRSINDASER